MPQRVWLVQCLCPLRHVIMAHAFEAPENPAMVSLDEYGPALAGSVDNLIDTRTINPWCPLCESPRSSWLFELARTEYTTMHDAMPILKVREAHHLAVAREAERRRAMAAVN